MSATRGKFYSAWCPYVQTLLDERGHSDSGFAALSKENQPLIHQYKHGHTLPPLKKLDRFARLLHLSEFEKTKFERLANLAHATEYMREIADREQKLEARIEVLESQLVTMAANLRSVTEKLRNAGINFTSDSL